MEWMSSTDSELKIRLKIAENYLDKINGDYGTKYEYCIFCGSVEYNGCDGIIHKHYCLIQQLRDKIGKTK